MTDLGRRTVLLSAAALALGGRAAAQAPVPGAPGSPPRAPGGPGLTGSDGAPPGGAPSGATPSGVIPQGLEEISRLDLQDDPSRRMGVEVRINGQGPFSFLVDTASERSVLSDTLAARLGLKMFGQVEVAGFAGSIVSALAEVRRLEVGARKLDGARLPVLPEAHLGALGLLGLDGLARQRLGIDFARRRLELRAGRGFDEEAGALVVRGRSRFGQLILVDSSVRATPIFVVLDTGAEDTLGNPALRALLSTRRRAAGSAESRPEISLLSVTGQTLPGEADSLPELRLGGVGLRNVPLVYADLETFRRFGLADRPALMLGMDALRAFQFVSIDFARHEVGFRLANGTESRA